MVFRACAVADGGDVRFQFGNGVSVAIPYNANANVVQQGLLSTGFLSAVSVDFSLNAYGQLCSGSGGGAVTLVTIVYPEVCMHACTPLLLTELTHHALCSQIPNIPSLQFVGNPTESGVYLAQLQAIFETLTLSTAPFQSSVAISLYTQGTRISSGLNATSSAVGAVYTFELVSGSGSFVQVCAHLCCAL